MKHIRSIVLPVVCGALLFCAGCSDNTVTCPNNSGDPPAATPETLDLRIGRTNDFALDLYGELSPSDDNLLVSPHSIITAFAMAYAGARGVTEREIAQVLHFNYPAAGFHSLVKQLNDILESRGAAVGPDAFRLVIGSAAFGREGTPYLQSYLDTLTVNYGAALQTLDYGGQPEIARLAINQWVFYHTSGLIKDLLPPGTIDPLTYLVLANTIYFHAAWLHQFDPAYTFAQPFTRLDGSQVSVPIMGGETIFPYGTGDGYQAAALPYVGEEASMLILLPDPGRFREFEASLSIAKIDSIASGLRERDIVVDLPRFSFQTEYDLRGTLKAMGMTTAFEPGADFSGIDGTGSHWINFVAHKAFIAVDEFGTMAAAGTGIGFTLGVPPHLDALRPFIFVIRDHETGTILFLGRVLDPSV